MARFASEAELESFLGRLDPDYGQYASALWQNGVRTAHQLANADKEDLVAAGVASAIHAKDIQARAEPRGPLLTLRDLVKQPLAKMRRRLTDRAPATKTKAVSPRTFSEVLPWDVFTPAALAQLQELDDTASCYMPQVYTPAGEAEGLVSPADEAEVRGYVFGFLQLLNHVASRCGLGVEYVGSGSNRNFCFTDLLLRQGNTDLTQLSSANWAVIGVKGPWQLRLPEDVSLGDSLNQPGYRKAVLPAMQQAYGDAVAEEAPIFAITNYDLNAAWQTGCQTKATREQPPQAAKRQKGLAIAPQADCGSGLQLHTGDGAMVTSKDHTSASDTLAAWTSHLSPQPEDVAVAQLPWLPAQNIHLTMECIASTSSVRVMKANQDKKLLVMKVFDDSKVEGITSFIAELKAYHALHDLQGKTTTTFFSIADIGVMQQLAMYLQEVFSFVLTER
ncbi:TPA: hypothetical protein ACH3X2_005043 [Trebouxia sp. C0005]